MNLDDYILDTSQINWKDVLEEWYWLLPENFTVWLVNRFGDIFMIYPDDKIYLLEIDAGKISHVANSQDHFCTLIDQNENADDWLLIPLINKLVAQNVIPANNECYSLAVPTVLGGQYELSNIKTCDIEVYYAFNGQIHQQIKDLPEGTKVQINFVE